MVLLNPSPFTKLVLELLNSFYILTKYRLKIKTKLNKNLWTSSQLNSNADFGIYFITPLPLHIIAINCTVNYIPCMNIKPGNLIFNRHYTDEALSNII